MAFPSGVPYTEGGGGKTNVCIELRTCQVLSMYYPLSGNKHTGEGSPRAAGCEGFKAGFSKITALALS